MNNVTERDSSQGQWVPPQFPQELQSMARPARRRPRLSAVLRGSARVLAMFGRSGLRLAGWFGQSVANDDSATPTAPGRANLASPQMG
jgi:hypothetical protein